jgi:peptidoglycan/LPS O-acetylase OafA/YrhL
MRAIGLISAYVAGMDTRISFVDWLDTNRKSPHSAMVIGIVVTVIYLIMMALLSPRVTNWRTPWTAKAGAVTFPLFLIHDLLGRMSLQQWGTPSNQYLVYFLTFSVILYLAFQFLKAEKWLFKKLGR